jgi:hypothetical protein
MRKKTHKPKEPLDVAMSAALNIAKLLVGEQVTRESYREIRDYVNSLPGVQIVSLPRDSEFGYVKTTAPGMPEDCDPQTSPGAVIRQPVGGAA